MKKLFFIPILLMAGGFAFAYNIELGGGYQLSLEKNCDAQTKPELSHNGAAAFRLYWLSTPQIGVVFKGAFGSPEEFEWMGRDFSKNDGDLLRFSGLLGGSIRFPLTKKIALVSDWGMSVAANSLSQETYLGEQNDYTSKYGEGYDTLRRSLFDSMWGVALSASVQYLFAFSAFTLYLEAGVSVNYNMTRQYNGTLDLVDKRQSIWDSSPPRNDTTITNESAVSSRVSILNVGIPFMLAGFRF
jgi:hypothetical protein